MFDQSNTCSWWTIISLLLLRNQNLLCFLALSLFAERIFQQSCDVFALIIRIQDFVMHFQLFYNLISKFWNSIRSVYNYTSISELVSVLLLMLRQTITARLVHCSWHYKWRHAEFDWLFGNTLRYES
jgi:hypothetical protein